MPEKALWWPDKKWLVIADLHVGKVEHFRKEGIGVPALAGMTTVHRLEALIQTLSPSRIIFLGDLFHSRANQSVDYFEKRINSLNTDGLVLIQGNHDIMAADIYSYLGIEVIPCLLIDNILLSHEPLDDIDTGIFNISGHIHPGVRLKGRGRQSATLSCFYFNRSQGILPAFGYFTGLHIISHEAESTVVAVAGAELMLVKGGLSL